MELEALCRISEQYAMDENKAWPKVVLEKKGLTYSRSIRKKADKRIQRKRSKSLPSIPINHPVKLSGNKSGDTSPAKDVNVEDIVLDCDQLDGDNGRIRQFSTTMKGLVNQGDLRKDVRRDSGISTTYRRNSTIPSQSTASVNYARRYSVLTDSPCRRNSNYSNVCTPIRRQSVFSDRDYRKMSEKYSFSLPGSQDSALDEECPAQYQVLVLGNSGVGKSALINQFTTSDFLGDTDVQTDDDEEKTSISVILNKEESILDLIESSDLATFLEYEHSVDAYMIVYSCADRNSFKAASSALCRLKEESGNETTVMLVANKVDLARKRQVNYEEGRVLANSYGCKYIETSAALNHNVDELLAGVLSQIRLKQFGQFVRENLNSQIKQKKQRGAQKGISRVLRTAFKGVFGKKQKLSSCENLYQI